jgi:hypothetical protein
MVPLLLAGMVAAASSCPDLVVTNPRLKVVRAAVPGYDNEIVTVDVRNRGEVAQVIGIRQRLDLVRSDQLIGSQQIPALGPEQSYVASFRLQVPHERKRRPLTVTFRYVLDSGESARNDCNAANNLLTATL